MKKITKIEAPKILETAKKLRVAAYCRVSTGMEDQLVSLEAQKAHYEELINADPAWEYAGVYYDEGVTGTKKEKRPALQQMLRDCEDGKIDRIVTKSLSRFARNTTDCLELVRTLLDLGIPVYFEKENLDTGSMESELLLSIMSSLAESESVSISENSKWSVRRRFENGTFKLGYAPYGYSVKDGAFFINEDEAKWVRYIFDELLAGKSTHKIAAALNEMRVPGRRGTHWTPTTVRGMLRNEKYIGDCLFQKTFTDFRFKRNANHGEIDRFYMKDHHEPIISREDFEAADRMLRQHAKEKNVERDTDKYLGRYPFTQKIVCGECGSHFRRRINSAGDLRYPAWVCREHSEHKENCSMKFVRETDLEEAFCTMMNKLVFSREEVLRRLLNAVRTEMHRQALRRIDEIEDALDGIRDRRMTLTTLMAKGYLDPASFTLEENSLLTEAAALKAEKERLAREVRSDVKKTEELREILKYADKGMMLSGFDADLFSRFVDHITVCSREEAVFHLKCGLNLRERTG